MNRFFKGLSYTFSRNMGTLDRLIRVVVASAGLGAWFFGWIPGLIGTGIAIFAIMLLGTAAVSRCSITYWMDANTMSAKDKKALDDKGIAYE